MFNLFSKKKIISEQDYNFLKAVVKSLPPKYSYLLNQVSKEFILDKKVNKLGSKGTYTLILNSEMEAKHSNKSLPQLFILRNIGVWNNSKKSYELLEIHILEGMLAGFRVNAEYSQLDLEKIDTSKIKEKHFKDEEKEFLKNLIGNVSKNVLSQLDIESTFKIELEQGDFYVIKDLEDGNYLSMNEKGAVFGMIHDPYEVEKLFDTKESFFEALKTGQFSVSTYYSQKIS